MPIISLGLISKKLIWTLIYIIIYACFNIYRIYNKDNIVTLTMETAGVSIGQILTVFVNCAFKYKYKRRKIFKQNYFKDFFILALINFFYLIGELFGTFLGKDDDGANYVNKFYFNEAIEIIFLSIITYYILKYKYYIHHVISMTAIVILSTSTDIVLKNFSHTNIFLVINSIIHVLADSALFCYYKYLIEFKYYYFLDVLLGEGIIHFSFLLLAFFFLLLFQNLTNSKTLITEISEYYEEFGIGNILLRFFFFFFIRGLAIGLFGFEILKELTPNHVIIAYELGRIPSSIIQIEGINKWIILIISLFQIIFLLFFLEIIEYNFCSLNENTKRSILERERKQNNFNNEDDKENEIILKGYDISAGFKNENNIETELEEISSEGVVDK